MANGSSESEDFVFRSGPRSGLKREFVFALKSQSQFSDSIGRTRSGRKRLKGLSGGSLILVGDCDASDKDRTFHIFPHEESVGTEAFEDKTVVSLPEKPVVNAGATDDIDRIAADGIKRLEENHAAEISSLDIAEFVAVDSGRTNEDHVFEGLLLNKLEEPVILAEDHTIAVFSSEKPAETLSVKDKNERIGETIGADCTANISSPGTPPPVPHTSLRITRSMINQKAIPVEDLTSIPIGEFENTSLSDPSRYDVVAGNAEVKSTDCIDQLSSSASKKNLELKMSKKIALDKLPCNIRELLSTGLLEGLPVKYLSSKNRTVGLSGTIQGCGILCSCDLCKGTKVVTAFHFEKHAGSLKKRSSEYIFLENGKTIRDIIMACRNAPLNMIEATIKREISSPIGGTKMCQYCKESLDQSGAGTSMSFCCSCLESHQFEISPAPVMSRWTKLPKPVSITKSSGNIVKLTPLLHKTGQGRVTKKDVGLHKLVFSEDGLPDGTEVAYYARGQRLLDGYKKGNGIFCFCCNTEVSPSLFEAHAGWSSRRKPYLNIYTSNGVSLHELSLSLSKGRKHSTIDNDDLCSICFDGGSLLLCDLCPRAFHTDCVGLPSIPLGEWYCRYCKNMFQREKFVEHNANAIAAGRVSGVDPLEQISKRSIRIIKVKTSEADVSCCVLCRGHDFSKSGFGPRTVLLCDQVHFLRFPVSLNCENEYHVGCLKDHKMANLKELPKGNWFCGVDCNRIYTDLHKLILRGSEKVPKSHSDVIKAKHNEKGFSTDADCDVRWRLLSAKFASPETRALLSKAVGIFHDRFDPILDSTTGRDLIPSMVYGRNMRDQEFGGMYCALLTVNSSVVSAGILRIFGQDVAEIPLVATSIENQGLGYFQSLFSCIEGLLGSLNVRNLVLPAADEAEAIWTNRFGFKKISQDQLCKHASGSRVMVFQGTTMLHKLVSKQDFNSYEGS